MTPSLDPRTIARIMGGDVIGRDRVLVPDLVTAQQIDHCRSRWILRRLWDFG